MYAKVFEEEECYFYAVYMYYNTHVLRGSFWELEFLFFVSLGSVHLWNLLQTLGFNLQGKLDNNMHPRNLPQPLGVNVEGELDDDIAHFRAKVDY